MSLKGCFQLWFISKCHPSPLPSPPCRLWTWPGWPRYLSPPGWILPWFTVFKTRHEADGQILAASHRNCFMLWDMSSDVQGPLLVMDMLPNTVRLPWWPIGHHLSLGTEQFPNLWMKHVTSVMSVEMRHLHGCLWIFHLQLQKLNISFSDCPCYPSPHPAPPPLPVTVTGKYHSLKSSLY